jgi:hypothetical protein
MSSPLPIVLCGLALVGISFATTVGERADRIIRVVTLIALLGTIVANRRNERCPGRDSFPIITCWPAVGIGLGVAIELSRAVP